LVAHIGKDLIGIDLPFRKIDVSREFSPRFRKTLRFRHELILPD